jgi:hypothetical protein
VPAAAVELGLTAPLVLVELEAEEMENLVL